MAKTTVTIRVEQATKTALETIAKEREESPADIMRTALESFAALGADGLAMLDTLRLGSSLSAVKPHLDAIGAEIGKPDSGKVQAARLEKVSELERFFESLPVGELLRLVIVHRMILESELEGILPPLAVVDGGALSDSKTVRLAREMWRQVKDSIHSGGEDG